MHPGFTCEPRWCCQSSGSYLAPLSPGRYWLTGDHTAPLAPLSPNLFITVAVLSSWHLFCCNMLYIEVLHAAEIQPKYFHSVIHMLCWMCFIFSSKQGWEITRRLLKCTLCRLQASPYTKRTPVMTAISFQSPKSHKITLKLQPGRYQVQVEVDTIEPWR